MKKLLLIQEKSQEGDVRVGKLESAGFLVLEADSNNRYWTKFVESGKWDVVVFDHSSFSMIFVEMATEFGSSQSAKSVPLIMITPDRLPEQKMPSPFRQSIQVRSDEELMLTLSEII